MAVNANSVTTNSLDTNPDVAASLAFDRWIARRGWARHRVVLVIGVVLILISVAVLLFEADGELVQLILFGRGRQLFFYPLMIVYLLAVLGPIQRTQTDVARALRPLIEVDDDEFAATVERAQRVCPISEILAFAAGVVFLLLIDLYEGNPEYRIASVFVYVAGALMFGVIAWSIFAGFTVTRLTNALLRLPMKIDIFDISGLAPIGRQSLYLALMFIGAIALSLFFIVSPSRLEEFLSHENIIIYSILITLTFAVFFLNMHRTHSLLSAARSEQLAITDHHLALAYYKLQDAIASGHDTSAASLEVNALATCKQELKTARTWPYNTEMLRTLAISVLTPLLLGLVRVVAPLFLQQ